MKKMGKVTGLKNIKNNLQKKIKAGLEFKEFRIYVPYVTKSYNKVTLLVKRGTTSKTYTITGDGILSSETTECYFADAFKSISAFDVDKKLGGYQKKTLNLTIMAMNDDLEKIGKSGEKDTIGSVEINISEYFGEKNKDISANLAKQKFPSSRIEFKASVCDPKDIIGAEFDENDSVNLTTMEDQDEDGS